MKKNFSIELILICLIILFVGCNKIEEDKITDTEETIKVMEKVYLDYINDIYLDSSKYIGKNIEIEGLFTYDKDENNKSHMYVYRLADVINNENDEHGHNTEEDEVKEVKYGLEFSYEKNILKENDWIKVIGKLKEKDGNLIIEATSVEVMENRGLEKVKPFY